MTRVAVIGDSHVAALKSAWDRIGELNIDVSVTFFAGRGNQLKDLVASGDGLSPGNERLRAVLAHTSGGLTAIVPRDYDLFLVYGLGLAPIALPETYSSAVIRQAVLDKATASLSCQIVTFLRAASKQPIYVGASPLLAPRARLPAIDPSIYAFNEAVLRDEVFAPLEAIFLPQPESTICRGFYTKRRFSAGSTRLDVGDSVSGQGHPPTERRHMNTAYGMAFWTELLSRLGPAPPAPEIAPAAGGFRRLWQGLARLARLPGDERATG